MLLLQYAQTSSEYATESNCTIIKVTLLNNFKAINGLQKTIKIYYPLNIKYEIVTRMSIHVSTYEK